MNAVSIRGAITVSENTREAILEATTTVLKQMIEANQIDLAHIVHVYFTGTKDLNAVYPAVAARAIGLVECALMCFQEFDVPGSLEKCIRVDMLVEQNGLTRQNVQHQYLGDAAKLRPDLLK